MGRKPRTVKKAPPKDTIGVVETAQTNQAEQTNEESLTVATEQPKEDLTTLVEAEIVREEKQDELSKEEKKLLERLEQQVKDSFLAAAHALREINEKRLYRETHKTFDSYCEERFGFKRRQAYHYIEGAKVTDALQQSARTVHILPANEYQIRPLASLKEPEKQIEAWERAVEHAGGKLPTHELVKKTVQEMLQRLEGVNSDFVTSFSAHDVCVVRQTTTDEHLSDRKGHVGEITDVSDETVTLQLWDRTVEANPRDLKLLTITSNEREERIRLLYRLREISDGGGKTESSIAPVLRYFGTLKHAALSDFDKKLLSFLERQFKGKDVKGDSVEESPLGMALRKRELLIRQEV